MVYIPYGVARLPFYDTVWPLYMQMASLGYIISHEMGHAIRPGWHTAPFITMTAEDETTVENYENCIIHNYMTAGSQRPIRTLEENFADYVGVNTILRYLRRMEQSQLKSGMELWMQTWCSAGSPRYMPYAYTESHSTPYLRANATISGMISFYQAFDCSFTNMMPC